MTVENELKDSMSASNYSGFEPDVTFLQEMIRGLDLVVCSSENKIKRD